MCQKSAPHERLWEISDEAASPIIEADSLKIKLSASFANILILQILTEKIGIRITREVVALNLTTTYNMTIFTSNR